MGINELFNDQILITWVAPPPPPPPSPSKIVLIEKKKSYLELQTAPLLINCLFYFYREYLTSVKHN